MRRSKRIISALLGLSLISAPIALSSTANAEDSLSSLQQQLDELEKQNEEYRKILEQTQSDINEKEKYKNTLVSKIEVLDDKIALMHQSIEELSLDISKKQEDIDKANDDIELQVETLCERLRTIYMAGSASDLEIIFGAKNFSDFIDKVQLIKTLSEYDNKLIKKINEELAEINEQIALLEVDKQELENQQISLESDQVELNTLLEENEDVLSSLYLTNKNAETNIKNAALESEEIENQIKAYYEALAAEEERKRQEAEQKAAEQQAQETEPDNSSSDYNGNDNSSDNGDDYTEPEPDSPEQNIPASGFTWPCPGFYYLTSEWNEDRGSYNHGAIDIAGGGIMGAPVVAADSGTVISSNSGCPHNWGKYGSCGCGGGYGNYIMIAHDGGKMTVYGHLSSLSVSSGEYVSKGQTIGYVGSTGESTGPHLHFECRLNGVKYNPMSEY